MYINAPRIQKRALNPGCCGAPTFQHENLAGAVHCRHPPGPGMIAAMNPTAEDHVAITNLLARYCLALDLDDVDSWVDLFTADASYEVFGRTWEGHEGLRKLLRAAPGGSTSGARPSSTCSASMRPRPPRTFCSSKPGPGRCAERCTPTGCTERRTAGASPIDAAGSSGRTDSATGPTSRPAGARFGLPRPSSSAGHDRGAPGP